MYPEFEQWLSVRVSEERKALLLDSFELLATLKDLRVWDSATNVMSLSERLDTATCLSDLEVEIREYCIQTCLDYGITLNDKYYDTTSQSLVNKLLMTLTLVDAWEDRVRILQICQSDESPEEILAALCEEISGVDADELLPLLEDVSVEKIEVLIRIYSEGLESPDPSVRDHEVMVLGLAKQFVGNPVADWLLQGGAIGLEFKHYLGLFANDVFVSKDPTEHAKAWLLMGLSSGVSENDLLYTHCVAYFDETYQSLESQSKVSKALKQLIGALS